MARVGRWNEPCEKLISSNTKLVDERLSLELKARMIAFYTP